MNTTVTRADPTTGTVVDLVEESAARHRDRVAAIAGPASLTFAELDTRANRLAHHLQALGVGPDVAVGVLLGRSLDLAVALLAVLKAGGTCVPVDPAYPDERVADMLGDASVAAVLTDERLARRVGGAASPVLRLDTDPSTWATQPTTPPRRAIGPDNVGYVIYTSGSTGGARGVQLTHRGLVNHHRAAVELYGLGPGDRVLQFCALGFDASIEELFPTWAAGGTVVFRPDDQPLLGRSWTAWLRDNAITVLNLPTAYWHAWVRDLEACGEPIPDRLRLVVVGGEKAMGGTLRTWKRVGGDHARWVNVYGPTETTCMSTAYEPPPSFDSDRDPPIGRPIANTAIAVVDDTGQAVPDGSVGELLIGGAGLARGYLNDPQLTAARFVDREGERVYRTGDLVRLLPDGNLDYLGRIDDQVKVRGFRVEPAEVESVLGHHPGVGQAVVVARDGAAGDTRLVAYVVPAPGARRPGDLRRFLAERIPAHLLPDAFVTLDALPLTPNGKVDRRALPDPPPPVTGRTGVHPASATEARIAAIWAGVLALDVDAVGTDDDFFALGGHSLLAIQLIAKVREEFGTDTPVRAIFDAPTIAQLASAVDAEAGAARSRWAAPPPIERRPGRPEDRVPLSLAQEQMWALETSADPPGLFNITALRWLAAQVDLDSLRAALVMLVDRHEVLRTAFTLTADGPRQRATRASHVELAVTSARDCDELDRLVAEADAVPFELANPPLVRAHVFHVGSRSRLAVTFDHLVADGTGATIFMAELGVAYEAFVRGKPVDLPPLPLQVADFASWQRTHLTADALRRQLDWWTGALAGAPLGPAVPFDLQPSTPTRRIGLERFAVQPEVRARLEQVAAATGSTVFVVASAVVQAVLGATAATSDVVVSTTLSGRNRAELETMVGTFSGIGRIRTDLSGDPAFVEIVRRTREHVLGMFENQDVPFLRVRRALWPHFPSAPLDVAAALPVDVQYFLTGPDDAELFFRGQLHPLGVRLLDSGTALRGEARFKRDFYLPSTVERLARRLEAAFAAVARDPSIRLSELPLTRSES